MNTQKFSGPSAIGSIAISVVVAGLSLFGCSSDDKASPSRPPIIKDDDAGSGGSRSGSGGASGGGGQGGGGTTSTGGGSNGGSGNGGTASGGIDGGSAGTGGTPPDGGTGGGPACDPNVTGSNPPGCFQCVATTPAQFLNHCTDSQCSAFDASRVPNPLPAPTW